MFEMDNQPIDFVDNQNGFHTLLKGLLDDRECLRAHTLDGVDHHKTAVTETHLVEYV